VADLNNLTYAVKTYQDQSIRSVDVKKALDAAKGEIKVIKLHSEQEIKDISTDF
jgi:choloylglycine hydrolase